MLVLCTIFATSTTRRNVVRKRKSAFTASEEFFVIVAETHILAAAMEVFGMSSREDTPSVDMFPERSTALSAQQRRKLVAFAVRKVLDQFVELSFPAPSEKLDDDHVQGYARDVQSLGLLYIEFSDAIREGDGLRILWFWRYFPYSRQRSIQTILLKPSSFSRSMSPVHTSDE